MTGVLGKLFCFLSDCFNHKVEAHHTVLSPKLSDSIVQRMYVFSLHNYYQVNSTYRCTQEKKQS